MNQVTQADVAREAGVSRGLVSLALSDSANVAEGTKQRILEVAHRLGYSRNLGAAMLAARSSSLVGVLLPNLRNPFFESVVSAIQQVADGRGVVAFTSTGNSQVEREKQVLRSFCSLRVGGVIAVSPMLSAAQLADVVGNTPACLVGASSYGAPVSAVHIDEGVAARLAVDHLLEQGFGELVVLCPAGEAKDAAMRVRSEELVRAAKASGASLRMCPTDNPYDEVRRVLDAARVSLPNEGRATASSTVLGGGAPPSERSVANKRLGIIAYNDQIGVEAVSAVRSLGLRLGVEAGVLSYDNTFYADRGERGITSIDQTPVRMAEAVFELLEDTNGVARDVTLEPQLVARASTEAQ